MTRRPTQARGPIRQLSLDLPATVAPPLEGVTREAVVRLLARLLTSACPGAVRQEGLDETR
jgi:hypothetical protein